MPNTMLKEVNEFCLVSPVGDKPKRVCDRIGGSGRKSLGSAVAIRKGHFETAAPGRPIQVRPGLPMWKGTDRHAIYR